MNPSNNSMLSGTATDCILMSTSSSFSPSGSCHRLACGSSSSITTDPSIGSITTAPDSSQTSGCILTSTFSDSDLGIFDSHLASRDQCGGCRSTRTSSGREMVVSPNTVADIEEFDEESSGAFGGSGSGNLPITKWCIEKEYVHVIYIDHSRLPEELEKRTALAAELARCYAHSSLPHTKHKQNMAAVTSVASTSATEMRTQSSSGTRSSARKMLTGESIRRLMKMVSPGSRRRRGSPDVHSSGSSLSGDTLTGSTRSVSGVAGELSEIRSPSSDLTNVKD